MGQVERRLGERLAELRRSAGFTQAKLAEQVGIATEALRRAERGATMPSLSRLDEIARALGVELDELFRFRQRTTGKDIAIERLLALVRARSVEDVDVIVDIATKI